MHIIPRKKPFIFAFRSKRNLTFLTIFELDIHGDIILCIVKVLRVTFGLKIRRRNMRKTGVQANAKCRSVDRHLRASTLSK